MVSVTCCCGFSSASSPSRSKLSSPVSPSVCALCSVVNCSGNTPMPTRFERWMRSKLRAMTALTPNNCVPLAAQSRDEPVPYSSREYQGRYAFLEIAHRGIINEHLFAARLVNRDAAFDARALRFRRNHQIFNPDVGKGAAHHHLMIAAPRAIAIEIGFLNPVFL